MEKTGETMPRDDGKQKKSFVFYTSYAENLKLLSDRQFRDVMCAVFALADGEEVGKLDDPVSNMAFSFISSQMRKDIEKWMKTRAARAESGRLGGEAKARNAKESKEKIANASKASKSNDCLANAANLAVDVDVNVDVKNTPHTPLEGDVACESADASDTQAQAPVESVPERPKLSRRKAKPELNLDGFDEFWEAWPRKVARMNAEKAWSTLLREGRLPDLDVLVGAAKAVASDPDMMREKMRFCPHPATWLNAERWKDVAPAKTDFVPERRPSKQGRMATAFLAMLDRQDAERRANPKPERERRPVVPRRMDDDDLPEWDDSYAVASENGGEGHEEYPFPW